MTSKLRPVFTACILSWLSACDNNPNDLGYPENGVEDVVVVQNKVFRGRIGAENLNLKTLQQTPQELVADFFKPDGPVLVLMSDSEHRAIGVRTTQANILTSGAPNYAFMEQSSSNQKLYDNFAHDFQAGQMNSDAVRTFKNQVSMNSNDYYAPPKSEPALRDFYFEETHRVYTATAGNNIPVSFIDASRDDPVAEEQRKQAAIAFNYALKFNNAYEMLSHLNATQNLPIQKAIAPLRQQIVNTTNVIAVEGTYSIKEEERLALYKIAKNILEDGFISKQQIPEGWPEGDITFETPLDFESIRIAATAVNNLHNSEVTILEGVRDDYRNERIVSNIAGIVNNPHFDKENLKGVLQMGQGHFDNSADIDEMLRETLPDLKIIRVDIIPVHPDVIEKLGTQTVQSNYQGSEYIIFAPSATAQYSVEVKEVSPAEIARPSVSLLLE